MTPSTVERTYVCESQLQVTALDPATAQEAIVTAVAAVQATLAAQTPPVVLSYEQEEGQPVLAET